MNHISICHRSGAPIEHAIVINNFIGAIGSQITARSCRVFADSVDYILPENDNIPIVPDASINCNIKARTEDAFTEAPKFALIVTDGTEQDSITERLELYHRIGTSECWVINWRCKQVDMYTLECNVILRCTVNEQIKADLHLVTFPECKITFDELFDFD